MRGRPCARWRRATTMATWHSTRFFQARSAGGQGEEAEKRRRMDSDVSPGAPRRKPGLGVCAIVWAVPPPARPCRSVIATARRHKRPQAPGCTAGEGGMSSGPRGRKRAALENRPGKVRDRRVPCNGGVNCSLDRGTRCERTPSRGARCGAQGTQMYPCASRRRSRFEPTATRNRPAPRWRGWSGWREQQPHVYGYGVTVSRTIAPLTHPLPSPRATPQQSPPHAAPRSTPLASPVPTHS
eukprot:scaffold785_cov85-Isochrysis_galbana.AAC.5